MTQTPTIEILLAKWIEAFNHHDLDKHMELYTEHALLFGSVDILQNGRDAVRAYFKAVGPDARVRSYPMPTVRHLSENFAGNVLSPFRMTWALVKQ
jgi:ketosteroid isomerase-like protein